MPGFSPDGTDLTVPMQQQGEYWMVHVPGATAGTRYLYRLDDGTPRPDPASRCQPEGVHRASEVYDFHYHWNDDDWKGVRLQDYVFYELHVGTFTPEGTFEAIIPHLARLKDLGITAIELMPIAQFPGSRNWGYDGVFPYAVQDSYGGATGLAKLVEAAHNTGIAVVLDVVYNHIGPEGNYFNEYGFYFTDCFKTPWGSAINYSERYSDHVRDFFVGNVMYWLRDFHIDALRLDACHYILDTSAYHILEEMRDNVKDLTKETGRAIHLVLESDANNPRHVTPRSEGGMGLDAQWLDDFHHSLVTLLNGKIRNNYLKNFGLPEQFVKAYTEGFIYSGQYCPSRNHKHGRSSAHIPGHRFVAFIQNHDQIGNSPDGHRLIDLISFENFKMAAAVTILSPRLPMLFMGEEYGETQPFLYFTDHSDEPLIKSIEEGRKRDFPTDNHEAQWADPQLPDTMERCIITHNAHKDPRGEALWKFHQTLFKLRKTQAPLHNFDKADMNLELGDKTLIIERKAGTAQCISYVNFSLEERTMPMPRGDGWVQVLDSASSEWQGPRAATADLSGSHITLLPESVIVLGRQ